MIIYINAAHEKTRVGATNRKGVHSRFFLAWPKETIRELQNWGRGDAGMVGGKKKEKKGGGVWSKKKKEACIFLKHQPDTMSNGRDKKRCP